MAIGDAQSYVEVAILGLSGLNWGSDDVKLALVEGYTPDYVAHTRWSDAQANEIAVANYTAGGISLTGKTVFKDVPNKKAIGQADNASWTNLGLGATPNFAIAYRNVGGVAANSEILSTIELGVPTNGEDYGVNFPNGVVDFDPQVP